MSGDEDLVAYLGEHPPFQSMAPAALTELASASSSHRFATGELIVDYSAHAADEVWMLRSGHVALFTGPGKVRTPSTRSTPAGSSASTRC